MPYRNNKTRSRRPRNNKTRKAYRKPKVSKGVKMYVKKAIASNSENKVYVDYGANQSILSASGTNPVYKSLIPPLSQGVGHGQRIGNEVKIKSAYIKGYVNLLPYNSVINPFYAPQMVKIWICSNKKIQTGDITQTSIATNFFELTGGTAGFQSNTLDLCFSPNKEYWTIYATKTFELGLTAGINTQYQDNSHFTRPFYFNYGKHLKSKLKYDDGATACINRNMFIVFQVVHADGSSTTGETPAEFHYSSRIEYEDQ